MSLQPPNFEVANAHCIHRVPSLGTRFGRGHQSGSGGAGLQPALLLLRDAPHTVQAGGLELPAKLLVFAAQIGEKPMDKDRIKGSAEQAKGKIKEVAGKATGDKKLRAEGKADKASGKIRNAVGGLKDAVRGR